MKITYTSDLHLEFSSFEIKNDLGSEVLILAGDICPIVEKSRWEDFLHSTSDEFCKTFLVAGNHEYYHGDIKTSFTDLLEITSNFKSVTVLNNSSEVYNGIGFYGSTLWTNFHNKPENMWLADVYMNDGKYINNFSSEESVKLYNKTIEWLSEVKPEQETNIMISHHGLHAKCVSAGYASSRLNPAYFSNVDSVIINKFDYWVSGHSHSQLHYKVNDTLLLRNPRGYPGECPGFELKYIEV